MYHERVAIAVLAIVLCAVHDVRAATPSAPALGAVAEGMHNTMLEPVMLSTELVAPMHSTEAGVERGHAGGFNAGTGAGGPAPLPGSPAARFARVATQSFTAPSTMAPATTDASGYVRPVRRSGSAASSTPAQPTGTGVIPDGSVTPMAQPGTNAAPGFRPPGK